MRRKAPDMTLANTGAATISAGTVLNSANPNLLTTATITFANPPTSFSVNGGPPVAYTSGDPVVLAKALSTWMQENAEFTFKLGIVDGKVIDVREIGELATMPGKEELFSKLLFLISSPAQRLATVINATGRDLAVVINQGVEKGKFAGPAAVAAPAARVAEAPAAVAAAPAAEAPAAEAPVAEGQLIAEAHAVEAPAADASADQPENSTASQGGEAATTDPVEG